MSNTDIDKLIQKLYEGTCSRQELELLFDHIQANPSEEYTEVMSLVWERMKDLSLPSPEESERIYKSALEKVKNYEQSSDQKPMPSPLAVVSKRKRWRLALGVAASVGLLLTLGVWLFYELRAPLITIQTAFAEQQTLTLPDSSVVELNANSSISYRDNWTNKAHRVVWLTGEAFFHVTKKQKTGQKFCVLTDDLTVEVLGTSFNVNTHHAETKVFLEEGKVKLNFDTFSEEMLMEPGELVTYSQKTKKAQKLTPKSEEPSSWRDGFVFLENAEFADILQKINEIYGLTYKVVDQAHLTRKFTLAIPIDNYDTMLSALQEITGLTVKRTDTQLVIE
ncbi:MAG: FecR domain-containing protein [Saprospiraceae bacterium]|nr:FecR domain-containing protein [Saprospiraceae bacterium]